MKRYMRKYYEAHNNVVCDDGPRDCLRCGADYVPNSNYQKFCLQCKPLARAELARFRTKEYCKKNPEKVKESRRRFYERRRGKFPWVERACTVRHFNKVRRAALGHYSGGTFACACCGQSELDFLALDHINNDGAKQRRELQKVMGSHLGGINFYQWLMKNGFPPGLQVYCANCNVSKAKHGVCIHQMNAPQQPSITLDPWLGGA